MTNWLDTRCWAAINLVLIQLWFWLTKSHLTVNFWIITCPDSSIRSDLKRFSIGRIESLFPIETCGPANNKYTEFRSLKPLKRMPLWQKKVLNISSPPSSAPTLNVTVTSCMILRNYTPQSDALWCSVLRPFTNLFYEKLIAKVKLLLKIHIKRPNDKFREFEVLFMNLILLRCNQEKQEIPN